MYFINDKIIKELSSHNNPPLKLIEFCKIININYTKKSYLSVIVFTRATLDYIPPIFGFENTSQVYSNLANKKTFKSALEMVDKSTRLVANDILHSPAILNEIIKVDKTSCDLIRDNLTIILDGVLDQLNKKELRLNYVNRIEKNPPEQKSQIQLFEKYLKNKDLWIKEFINDNEVWIYSKDNSYQICQLDNHHDFSEPWTQVWPDTLGSGKYSVDLKVNNTTIKQFIMVYFDGGRESLILPKTEIDTTKNLWENKDILGGSYKNVTYYIIKDSIEYNLSQLIGSNVERVAKRSHIEIR